MLSGKGKWLDRCDKRLDARLALTGAVEHQRQAVLLSKNAPACRLALASHLVDLATIHQRLGAYDEAYRLALEVPRTVPIAARPEACYDAAQVLARLVVHVDADQKLPQSEHDRLTRHCLARTVVLLREAIDAGPKLAEQIKGDPDIKALETRPRFRTIMNSLVELGQE
jgi:hypothetical protein